MNKWLQMTRGHKGKSLINISTAVTANTAEETRHGVTIEVYDLLINEYFVWCSLNS